METKKESALRYNAGKMELHHFSPKHFKLILSQQVGQVFDSYVLAMNAAMDGWFYRQSTEVLNFDLTLEPELFAEMTEVLKFGAIKYASLNYTNGLSYSGILNSFRRHLLKAAQGQERDLAPDGTRGKDGIEFSGLSHPAHMLCNVMFAQHHMLVGVGLDDRPKGFSE